MDTLAGSQKILVKTPLSANGKEDFTIEISPNWSVRQLKEQISQVLPKKTAADDQKLIFSGSVLADSVLLRDCFRSVAPGSSPVVHLVCKLVPSPERKGETSTSQSEGLHRRNVPQPAPVPVTTTSFTATNPWISSQTATPTFDQAHMAQYYQSYQTYLQQYMYSQFAMNPMMQQPDVNHGHMYAPNGTPGGAVAPNMVHMNQPHQFDLPNNAGAPGMAGGAVADPQVVLNAQGGAVIADGDGDQRDAFDHAYIFIRILALLFAVYFSSSTSRFFWAFTMLSAFLLLNTFRDFKRWRERQMRQNREAVPPMAVPPPPPHAAEQAEAPLPPVAPPVAAPEAEAGLLMTVLNLVVGFFTTLVPDMQAVLA